MQIHGSLQIRYTDNTMHSCTAWYCMVTKKLMYTADGAPLRERHYVELSVHLNGHEHRFVLDVNTFRLSPQMEYRLHNALYACMADMVNARNNNNN